MDVELVSCCSDQGTERVITAVATTPAECRAVLSGVGCAAELTFVAGRPALRWRDALPHNAITVACLERLAVGSVSSDVLLTTLQQLSAEALLHASLSFLPEVMDSAGPVDPDATPAWSADTHQPAQSAER